MTKCRHCGEPIVREYRSYHRHGADWIHKRGEDESDHHAEPAEEEEPDPDWGEDEQRWEHLKTHILPTLDLQKEGEMTEQTQSPMSLIAMPVMDIEAAKRRRSDLVRFVKSIMVEGVDFGTIPGTPRPTLLLPGAEKLTTFFGLNVRFQCIDKTLDWTGQDHGGEPFIEYSYRCQLYRANTLISESEGCCNSWESRYRWRWVPEHEIPLGIDKAELRQRGGKTSEFAFAVEKGETTGKYGKPAEYWQRFRDAITDGSAIETKRQTRAGRQYDAWEIDSKLFRVPNEDIASQANTICKISQKRSFTSATKIAVNASEFFTVDTEDFLDNGPGGYGNGETVEGTFTAESGPEQEQRGAPEREAKTAIKSVPHWIDSDKMRVAFWRWSKDDMILTEAQVYDKLGVSKIHDYTGTAQDAKVLIEFCVAIEKWAFDDQALKRDQMLDALDVEHEREWNGTLQEAKELITGWVEMQSVATTIVPKPEPGENSFEDAEEAEAITP